MPKTIPNKPLTYEEFCAEQDAIHDGSAIALTHCYLCEPDLNKRTLKDAGPLRGVLRLSFPRGQADPTMVLHLSCGHSII